jgi:hypothetical protein
LLILFDFSVYEFSSFIQVLFLVPLLSPPSSSSIMAAAAAVGARRVGGSWSCLSAHVPASGLAAAGNRLLGRSSNAAGIVGQHLLVFSGENIPRVPIDKDVHIFDLVARKWNAPVAAPAADADQSSWPCARIGHASAVAGDALYISGGRTGLSCGDATLADLWKFKPATRKWEQVQATGDLPPPLSYHVLTGDSGDDSIYLMGGCTADHGRSNGLWRFDTKSNVWTELSALSAAGAADDDSKPCVRGGPGVAAGRGAVWVAFGYSGVAEQQDLWRFDIASRKWERKWLGSAAGAAEGPEARSVTDLVFLKDYFGAGEDALVTWGGEYTPSAQGHEGAGEYHDASSTWLFDIARNTWIRVAPSSAAEEAPVARGWFNTVRYGDKGQVVSFGGFDGKERRNDVYLWTPMADAESK